MNIANVGKVSLNTKAARGNNIFVQLPSLELMLNIVAKKNGFNNAQISDQLSFEKEGINTGSAYLIQVVLRVERHSGEYRMEEDIATGFPDNPVITTDFQGKPGVKGNYYKIINQ